jgi:hypothetical protein
MFTPSTINRTPRLSFEMPYGETEPTMKTYILTLALVVAALSVSAQPAAATSIDTTTSDVGNVSSFGPVGVGTMGQTFTASGPDTQLDSFSLYLRDGLGGVTLDLRGYIASWDSVNARASSILFESTTQTMNAAGTLQEFAFAQG